VDSAVAALRLIEQGRVLETATVRLWGGSDRRSCCSPGALQRARQTALWLGLPHTFVDREADFAEHIVNPFVDAYVSGETPNPCVDCNPRRLAALVEFADELGCERVATGHYARLVWRGGAPFVARGADAGKDQSYMLWAVPAEVLARLEFPLGDGTKPGTRAAAAVAGLPVAVEPESQEVCFAADGYQKFLAERGVPSADGAIVDRAGCEVGRHLGQWRFTVGQRRGLGVSSDQPLFVLERRAAANEIVVGPREALAASEVTLRGLVDRGLGRGAGGDGLMVQLRYRSAAVPVAALTHGPGRSAALRLAEPFEAVAPGQSAVFYRDDVVMGGGIVDAPA